jgi:demethoxyubiquinone hydroxylase (CLK1/Coq7/Cat5 family)
MSTEKGRARKADPNRDPLSGEPGAHPVGTAVGAAVGGGAAGVALGGGAAALAATGATIGAAAGPIGAVAGAVAGGIAGGLIGKKVAESVHPTIPEGDVHASTAELDLNDEPERREVRERHWERSESSTDRTESLDTLLRSELAAVETYRQALDKFSDQDGMYPLTGIAQDHRQAVFALQDHITERGATPSSTSGAWAKWAQAVEGGAGLFGKTAALKALKEGEEQGIEEYEEAIKDPNLDPECLTLIQFQLLPQTRQHVSLLDQMLAVDKQA